MLRKLVDEGRLRPAIGAQFSLEDTPQALRHLETGHAQGKVVVAVA